MLLAEGRRAVTVSSAVPFTAVDASGLPYKLPKGSLTLRADLALPSDSGPVAAIQPLVLRPGKKAPLALDGKLYRGKLELVPQGEFLRVVNVVPLESYLDGVVAGEVPFSWPAEALKAQAVAARSYALASVLKGKPFDLYADARSQVYLGVAGEKPSTTKAVDDTAGEVVLYGGRVATTYYFSTSGGKTASAADVFGFAVPYLVSRPDPWDKLSPYHRWGPVLVGARTMQSKLAAEARVLDARGVATPSGRLRTLTLDTTAGSEQVPATLVRTALGLRSTWLTIGVLRLDRASRGAVVFGSTTHLSGVGRGLGATRLASSFDGAAWATVASGAAGCHGRRLVRRHADPDDALPARGRRRRIARAARAGGAAAGAHEADGGCSGRPQRQRQAETARGTDRDRTEEGFELGARRRRRRRRDRRLRGRAGRPRARGELPGAQRRDRGIRRRLRPRRWWCPDEADARTRECRRGHVGAAGDGRSSPLRGRDRQGRQDGGRRRRDPAANRLSAGESRADPGTRRRRPRGRLAPRDPRCPLCRAARHAPPRVHPDGSARAEAVVSAIQRLLRSLGHPPGVRADPGRGHRLRRRRRPSRSCRKDPRREELRRRIRAGRHLRPRDVRRRVDRRRARQRHRHRRARAVLRTPDREGRDEGPRHSSRCGGAGDSLGGRQRCARHQHEPRRGSRPARSRAGHVLAPGSRCRRLRGLERRGRRRCRRQLGPGARQPLEVRELSRRAPTCARCQRDERHRGDPVLLESRSHLQRSCGTRARDPLDSAAPPHGAFPAVQRAGVLELRPRGVSGSTGDVVRRAAGDRCGGGPAQPPTDSPARAGREDPAVDGNRPVSGERLSPPAQRAGMPTRARGD